MLYKKNNTKSLDLSLFRSPTAEYRGAPFWAWNCRLDKDELMRQIEVLGSMGFGGFHMHVRYGLDTPYLSEEFMSLIKSCVEKAKSENMLAWLYDEDRWPSGFAGGLVTKDPQYRARFLVLTTSLRDGEAKLIGKFDVLLDSNGCLEKYRILSDGDIPFGNVWYAYIDSPKQSNRYNGQTYVNTLDKASIDKFIEITHKTYKKHVGDDFGEAVPAIFTDEPQFTLKTMLSTPFSLDDVTLPWSDDLESTYKNTYGDSLISHIPELFWELKNYRVSVARYRYHVHVAERFANAFSDNIGDWCDKNSILFTGHMMREPLLTVQCASVGDAMRQYRNFHIPGIDILCNRYELTTAKQAQSAVHQFGREGMMSELYGVTGWDFDFRGHKLQGDWQAALGVTVRVPHLSWVSMQGEAKRDYPASISYQSPWYKEYPYIEDHFARLNTALTRGKPEVKVGVIHPIESCLIHWGPSEQNAAIKNTLDNNFVNITSWLLYGSIDFDYINESLIPYLYNASSDKMSIGKMRYDVIVVPGCETLRSSTYDMLENFVLGGGRVIFAGQAPYLMDAMPSDKVKNLYEKCEKVDFSQGAILRSLKDFRNIEICTSKGELSSDLLHQLRRDGDTLWLFICKGKPESNPDLISSKDITVKIAGTYKVLLYNTLDGTAHEISSSRQNGWTYVNAVMYNHDSMLLNLVPCDDNYCFVSEDTKKPSKLKLKTPVFASFKLDEPNALLLDMAYYALDEDEYSNDTEELLKIDTMLRKKLGWMPWNGDANQPWLIEDEPIDHSVKVKFDINCETMVTSPMIALETPEVAEIHLDGKEISINVIGWYVDKSIKTVKLPSLTEGHHTLEIKYPFGKRTALEWCYLLGDFGVNVRGTYKAVVALPEKICHDDITRHFLPFYSGKISYFYDIESSSGDLEVKLKRYRASTALVSLDNEKAVQISFAPYSTVFRGISEGRHKIRIDLYISRTNGFGPVHNTNLRSEYLGPNSWRTSADKWSYEYNLTPEGLLSAPQFTLIKE